MKYVEEPVPNERLRRARILKGWSQADLAEQVGTSFETVSRWERGITAPSLRYCKQLSQVLGKSAEELATVGTGDSGPPRRDRGDRGDRGGRDGRDRDRGRGGRDRDRDRGRDGDRGRVRDRDPERPRS